jgi:ankyrin repeat protein
MKFNNHCLILLLLAFSSSQLFSMEEQPSPEVNSLPIIGSASDLKCLAAFSFIDRDQSVIMDLPIPEELKDFVLEKKNLMTIKSLLEATQIGDVEKVKFILNFGHKFGITVNSKNADGDTPSIIAARFNKPELTALFIQKRANLVTKNNVGIDGLNESLKHESADLILLYFWNAKLQGQQKIGE